MPTLSNPQAAQASLAEALAGLVERVTYHNEGSAFGVLRVKARGQRDLITIVGHAATISVGEWVQMSGTWVNDRTHGLQFRASFLKAAPATTLEGMARSGRSIVAGAAGAIGRRLW
ncbi:MAG: hypothetical protein ACJ8AW_55010 [Rhodopila sp.]